MALWGNTDADEAKPKWMTSAEKADVFATDRGWVKLNGKGLEEVICSIGGLSTAVGGADINTAAFVSTAFDVSAAVLISAPPTAVDNPHSSIRFNSV